MILKLARASSGALCFWVFIVILPNAAAAQPVAALNIYAPRQQLVAKASSESLVSVVTASSRPTRHREVIQRVCRKVKLTHGRKVIRRICVTAIPTRTVTIFPMSANREVFGSTGVGATVDEAVLTMAPGEIRRVTAQLEIRSGEPSFEVDMGIFCYDQQGELVAQLPDGGTYPANDPLFHGGGNGTNYFQDDVPYQWNASMLIQAPSQNPEENYLACSMRALTPATP
jgi:hypothetical protein